MNKLIKIKQEESKKEIDREREEVREKEGDRRRDGGSGDRERE